MIKVETDERSGFVALVFPDSYNVTTDLYKRMRDEGFHKSAAKPGKHFKASPHPHLKAYYEEVAETIKQECLEGLYKKEMLYPTKTRIKHG